MNDWVHDRPYTLAPRGSAFARDAVPAAGPAIVGVAIAGATTDGAPASDEPALGIDELEAGMRPGHARQVPIIAMIAFVMLLTFNSGGLVKWMEGLPSNATTAWLAERAGSWHEHMRDLGPARWFESLRERIKIE